ncbi:hypothetical protein K491DRAFT_579973, partial [Lophiostoma macrostomum CBS 122681]
VKCDERLGGCQRCAERGVGCPGYRLNVRWSSKHQVPSKLPDANSLHPVESTSPVADTNYSNAVNDDCVQLTETVSSPGVSMNHTEFICPVDLDLDSLSNWDGSTLPLPTEFPGFDLNSVWAFGNYPEPHNNRPGPPTLSPNSVAALSAASTPRFRELCDVPSALCSYFFKNVITLYCVYDSGKNMMRVLVEQLWQDSSALHHTIQSMAAICLSSDFPHLATVASSERELALQCLRDTPKSTNDTQADHLLSIYLLGHTASWHHPHELAKGQYHIARKMQTQWLRRGETRATHYHFFEAGLEYWQMLLAFVTGDPGDDAEEDGLATESPRPAVALTPELSHPFYGVSRTVVRALTDIGSLVFNYRKRMAGVKWLTLKDVDVFHDALCQGRLLQRTLLSHKSSFEETGDPSSSCTDLHTITEAYQCAGLLQLYRVFPDLLQERYQPWETTQIFQPETTCKILTCEEREMWLTKFALRIIDLVKRTSLESHTRCVQPFLFVVTSSELRLAQQANAVPDAHAIEVAHARKFIKMRLSAYSHILPLRKVQKMQDLVNMVFTALDDGDHDVYWMDIARRRGLETMMG